MRWLVLVLLFAGCATLPPHATNESMADRARCLDAGAAWSQQGCGCRPIPHGYPTPMPGGGIIVPNAEPI